MIFPIISTSALEFYLSPASLKPAKGAHALCSIPKHYDLPYQKKFVKDLANEYGLALPLSVMACKSTLRCQTDEMHCYIRSKNLPERSFLKLDEVVYISSPELCITQVAPSLSLERLIETINNLCAIYVQNPAATFFQSSRAPLTSVKAISSFVKKSPKLKGARKVQQALQYALDCSNSPMESKLAVLCTLPLSLGGYALPKPQLNGEVHLSAQAEALYHMKSVRCDFVWYEQKIILEYDSNLSHLDPKQHAFDKQRRNALEMSGYKVISITAKDIQNYTAVDKTFRMIRKELGLRADKKTLEKYFSKRYDTVISLLFSNKR